MSNPAPEWTTASVLRVCRPELMTDCDWPACTASAEYELELELDGEWLARRVCPTHQEQFNVSVGDGESADGPGGI